MRLLALILGLSMIFVCYSEEHSSESATDIYTSLDELPLDEEQRLLDHHLLYLDLPHCYHAYSEERIGKPAFRHVAKVSGLLAFQMFAINISSARDSTSLPCAAVCLERGTRLDHILHPLPKHINRDGSNIPSWVSQKCQRAEFGFISYADNPAVIYYVPADGEEVMLNRLEQREKHTSWQQSFLGHRFRVRDEVTNEILGDYLVEFNAINVVGISPQRLQHRDNIPQRVEQSLQHEWDRANRVKRTFTEVGFARGKLPLDLFSSMSSYHYNNRFNRIYEEWNTGGVVVNWWEANIYMTLMPWGLKKYWQSRLKVLVEAWSGVELELTDIYGMRRYEDGARLLTHVDREATHAASLIINIAQGDIRKPWAVEIYDFAGRLHEVLMEEGDIVYYESARCLHGRMQPLEGGFYTNLFAHYRPVGDPEWFLKENPSDAPLQKIDIGECVTDGEKVNCSAVEDGLMPFLSPKLELISGPTDLYKFWVKTSPEPTVDSIHSEL
mmetsp:Transcript_11210/g.15418  ORF Transcript_11210/g.15418 Transcript_11210/m.15418 type:complete len:498 (-) Transcript_11210:80-1573(-)